MFPARSPRIRHRNELTERDWENAVQGLGKEDITWPRGDKRGYEFYLQVLKVRVRVGSSDLQRVRDLA